MRSAITTLLFALVASALSATDHAHAQPLDGARAPESTAVVVLVAQAGEGEELRAVLTELLLRQGVAAQLESRARFEPDAWLDASTTDARAWVFVTLRDAQRAQLFFRGPHGERFMLRELELRDGLDEVGRELIARVVETSVVALLHSSEGMSRDEARAGLENAQLQRAPAPAPEPQQPPPPAPPEPARHRAQLQALFGLRLLGHWTGDDLGARLGAGLEAGFVLVREQPLELRARLTLEAALPQRLQTSEVNADVITVPLRVGVDVGAFGMYAALSTGFDVVYVDPEPASASPLALTSNSTEIAWCSRLELRYELVLGGPLYLALGALLDVPWTATHYDVIEDGAVRHIATPWRVHPGLALTFGVKP